MEIDEVRDLMGEYSARLGAKPPRIRRGRVDRRHPTGLRIAMWGTRPTVVVGDGFAELDRADQEAQLIGAAVLCRLARGVSLRAGAAYLAIGLVWGVAASVLGLHALPAALFPPIFLGTFLVLIAPVGVFLQYRMYYRTDRIVAEVFGWHVLDTAIEFDRANPMRNVAFRLLMPSAERRMARLDRLRAATIE
ncbi:hypothetical protein [Thermomonospora amylolytica]|uniref:hypothetical protein n=1 Tax=Thermomonospora amylolytica TaxID=1411117 RepID=UPI000E6BB346|nr:hypothetical protein [Thermomonospora amylolytica]